MIVRICGIRTLRWACHRVAPSSSAASVTSPGSASSAAVKMTTPKPSCCQITTAPIDGHDPVRGAEPVEGQRAEPDVVQERVEHAVALQQERERQADRGG